MDAIFRSATPGDFSTLITLLDNEFIHGKGRRISLADRFPAVYCLDNLKNLYVAEEAGTLVSALAIRQFVWSDNGTNYRGAMLGGVCTSPYRRNEGWAGRLLAHATEMQARNGTDFAVLWTATPLFYARRGWILADRGLLGEGGQYIRDEISDGIETFPASCVDHAQIETLRRQNPGPMTLRHANSYRQIPPPAESVSCLLYRGDRGQAGYAMAGMGNETVILYEMIGSPESFRVLWQKICSMAKRILVNDHPDNASYQWLTAHAEITWHTRPLAMWNMLSSKARAQEPAKWYVPYFDRI